jgi:hypothetical protein
MNKAKMNYWVDVGIGFAGIISALSGLVFLLPGFRGSGHQLPDLGCSTHLEQPGCDRRGWRPHGAALELDGGHDQTDAFALKAPGVAGT